MYADQGGIAMKRMRLLTCALLLLVCGACLLPISAQAAQCTVQSSGVSFGVYDPLNGTSPGTNGSVTVTCTYTTLNDFFAGFQVTIDLSTGSSNSYAPRAMKRGAEALSYNLYKDPPHNIVFGDGSGITQDATVCFPGFFANQNCNGGSTNPQTVQVYGLLPANQDISAGNYSDTIVTTLTF